MQLVRITCLKLSDIHLVCREAVSRVKPKDVITCTLLTWLLLAIHNNYILSKPQMGNLVLLNQVQALLETR